MHRSLSRSRLRWLFIVVVAAAFAAPAAQARHAPADHLAATSRARWSASPLEIDRLGPKYVQLQHRLAPPPVNVVTIARPGGFHWADAAVGAAVAALALASAAGLALVVTPRRPALRKRSDLGNA
jgi:hypothetical protein